MSAREGAEQGSAAVDFGVFIRSGRLVPVRRPIEVKFNPYHDPKDGRFTFGPGGVGGGVNVSRSPDGSRREPGHEDPRVLADDQQRRERDWAADLRNPANLGIYTVKPGDTLTHIASTRVGLTVKDLATYNSISPDAVIRPGQQLILPTQAGLDRAKKLLDAGKAYLMYAEQHRDEIPPPSERVPSVTLQAIGPGAREFVVNGYRFTVDSMGRTRLVTGTITLNPDQQRSKGNQLAAGGSDRLPNDDGGHYIAREFNGPTEAYNHFAQNANFNRSGYRKLENIWGAATRRGEKVHVTIGAAYEGASQRPYEIEVYYTIAGITTEKKFSNSSRK